MRHQEAAVAGAEHGQRAGIGDGQTDGRREAQPDGLEGVAEARGARIGHAQEARHPAAEMAGVRGNGALLRQDGVDGLAERARIDELGGRRVLIGRVVIVAVVACACACVSSRRPARGPTARLSSSASSASRGHPGIGLDGDAGPASGSRACAASTSICATTAPGAISLPRLVVQCVRLTPKPDDEIALGDQLVRRRRGKAAADADRPRVAGKQAMPADRGRQQRAGALGQRDQRRLCAGRSPRRDRRE